MRTIFDYEDGINEKYVCTTKISTNIQLVIWTILNSLWNKIEHKIKGRYFTNIVLDSQLPYLFFCIFFIICSFIYLVPIGNRRLYRVLIKTIHNIEAKKIQNKQFFLLNIVNTRILVKWCLLWIDVY